MQNKNTTISAHETSDIPKGYRGIYLERSGESAHALVEQLVAAPECPLTEQQKQQVYGFESSLYDYEVEPGKTLAEVVKSSKGEDIVAPMFFADAFINGEVDTSFLDDETQVPDFQSSAEVYTWVAELVRANTNVAALRRLAKQSKAHYENKLAESLVSGKSVPESAYDTQSIVLNPSSFLSQCSDLYKAREYLLSLRHDVKEDGQATVESASRAVIDVYLGKVNSVIATNIPIAYYLMEQGQLIGDNDLIDDAEEAIPRGLRMAIEDPTRQNDVFKRLDYLRNGMGIDSEGRATQLSEKLFQESAQETSETSEIVPLFSEKAVSILRSIKLNPEELRHLFEEVLRRADLLSEDDSATWSPERSSRAHDEKYQVVINPGKDNFAVDGTSGAYKVSANPRSLYDAIVVGGLHETEHINQSEADRKIGKVLKIGELKGRRLSMLREAGANARQRQAELSMFGRRKGVALTYARALQSLESGGNIATAAKAFYDEKVKLDPGIDRSDAAKEAADRVIRLVRQGGVNSQALAYAEETIMTHELADASAKVRTRAMLVTSLDLVDQVRLHKYGLLPEINNETIDWEPYVLETFAPVIDRALAGLK